MQYHAVDAFGEAPCGAAKRLRGVPKWAGRPHAIQCFWRIRWSSVCGQDAGEECAEMGVEDRVQYSLLRPSVELPAGPWGPETCKRCAEMGGGTACSTTFLEPSVELRGGSTCA